MLRTEGGPRGVWGGRPEPNAGERDEVEGDQDGHGALPEAVFQFPWADGSPQFVDRDGEAIQAAPDDEVPARPVPQAAQEHGHPDVDVGDDPPVEPGNAGHGNAPAEEASGEEAQRCQAGPNKTTKVSRKPALIAVNREAERLPPIRMYR